MLIKTTRDNEHNYFFSFMDKGDTQKDIDVAKILYKIWVMNTSNDIILENYNDRQSIN